MAKKETLAAIAAEESKFVDAVKSVLDAAVGEVLPTAADFDPLAERIASLEAQAVELAKGRAEVAAMKADYEAKAKMVGDGDEYILRQQSDLDAAIKAIAERQIRINKAVARFAEEVA